MKVYMTLRNADMIEGRGPMLNDLCFLHYADAALYIDDKPGCMGYRRQWSTEKYGDWQIKEIEVLEGPFDAEADLRMKALAKLTDEEKKVLGLK